MFIQTLGPLGTFLADVTEALVFYPFREFAAIYCLHMTVAQDYCGFEKYGHLKFMSGATDAFLGLRIDPVV